VWADAGRVRCSAPRGVITPALHQELTERRDEILAIVTRLAVIQTEGTRAPFFFLYADWSGGGGFWSVKLKRHLGSDQPYYVFHPWGLDGDAVPPTVEAMAEEYLRALRAVHPTGPYLLGGYCIGGMIALEMAQRLRAQGERVDFLLTINSQAWNVSLRSLRRLCRRLGTLGVLSPSNEHRLFLKFENALVAYWRLQYTVTHPRYTFHKIFGRLRGERIPPARPSMLDLVYRRAAWSYVPEPYAGPITLFVVDEFGGDVFEANWRKVSNEIEVYRMPGDHLGVVKEHVDVLGKQLGACLEAVAIRGEGR
jgi:thioesterase domain-containing protein